VIEAFVHQQTLPQQSDGIAVDVMLAICDRDKWTCRYCGTRTISLPVLNSIADLFPTVFQFDPRWKSDKTDVAFAPAGTAFCALDLTTLYRVSMAAATALIKGLHSAPGL
jgi:hypothetical protein